MAVTLFVFAQGWEMSKQRQDETPDRIERGVGRLGEMARNMQEEVRGQHNSTFNSSWTNYVRYLCM